MEEVVQLASADVLARPWPVYARLRLGFVLNIATAMIRTPAHGERRLTNQRTLDLEREWEEAVLQGALDELQGLAASGVDINARNARGQTALMIAAADGRADVVQWLAARGADLDHTAKYGLSALMLAVVRGHVDVVRILRSAGATITLRGTGAPGFAGKTALDLAVERDDGEMVEILRVGAASPDP